LLLRGTRDFGPQVDHDLIAGASFSRQCWVRTAYHHRGSEDDMERLIDWQWRLYPDGHRTRRNLGLHLVTVPLFQAGAIAVAAAPFVSPWAAAAGAAAMIAALVAQGRGHAGEPTPPVPFRGAGDFVARFFTEQFVTFPRFVLSGGLARAWRDAGAR